MIRYNDFDKAHAGPAYWLTEEQAKTQGTCLTAHLFSRGSNVPMNVVGCSIRVSCMLIIYCMKTDLDCVTYIDHARITHAV